MNTPIKKERGVKMKKVMMITISMVFVLTLGFAYAANNGVTNFSGLNYDIGPAGVPTASVESVNAGGIREEGPSLSLGNSVTDFSGKTYDTLSDIGLAAPVSSSKPVVESIHGGGLRRDEPSKELFNGVTDFTGRTYDSK